MSEDFNGIDTDDAGTQDQQDSPRALREAANRAGKFKAEAESLRRENAFLKAGINSDDPRLSYFVKGYDGDLDPQTIRKAAVEAGFIQPPGTPQQTQQMQQTAAAQQRVTSASAGAMQEGATEAGALAALEAAMAEGGVEAMLDVARQFGIPVAQ